MAGSGWGYGSWGGGPWGVGQIIVGTASLSLTTYQTSWKSDMIITVGHTSLTGTTTFPVTLELGAQPTAGTVANTITGYPPNILLGTPMVVTAGAASLTITEYAPTPESTPIIEPGVTSVTITEYAPTPTMDAKTYPGVGSTLGTTSYQVSVVCDGTPTLGVGSLTISSSAQGLEIDNTIPLGVVSLSVTGIDVSTVTDQIINVGVGTAFNTTGYQVSLTLDAKPQVGYLSLFDSTYQVSLQIGQSIAAGFGTLSTTGQQISLLAGHNVPVGVGNMNFTNNYPIIALGGSADPAGRSILIQSESRGLTASNNSINGQDLVVSNVDQNDLSRIITIDNIEKCGNDVQKVA